MVRRRVGRYTPAGVESVDCAVDACEVIASQGGSFTLTASTPVAFDPVGAVAATPDGHRNSHHGPPLPADGDHPGHGLHPRILRGHLALREQRRRRVLQLRRERGDRRSGQPERDGHRAALLRRALRSACSSTVPVPRAVSCRWRAMTSPQPGHVPAHVRPRRAGSAATHAHGRSFDRPRLPPGR